jgi:hypothetical protein
MLLGETEDRYQNPDRVLRNTMNSSEYGLSLTQYAALLPDDGNSILTKPI